MEMTGLADPGGFGRDRSAAWRWSICVLLLLATVVNYMDRLTANTLSVEIMREFRLDNEQYGQLELGFGLAFAAGSLVCGWLVDRFGVYWLYPGVLVGWSAMGFLTGLSRSFNELLVLRTLLGLFESGHFPCGLKTIQTLLAPRDRAMGNSLIQSGAALGAVLAPQAIKALLTGGESGWRMPFLVIGAGGASWVVLWFLFVRPSDVRPSRPAGGRSTAVGAPRPGPTFLEVALTPRYLSLAILVVCINLNWHLFRVWLPKFLREGRGYGQDEMLNFMTLYYAAADAGVLTAGAVSGWLARRGFSVHSARLWVFAGCCLLTTSTTAAALLPAGRWLTAALLTVACGGLGVFPIYYALTQDLSREHQGKVSGSLSTVTWLMTATFHPVFGRYLDRTRNYDLAIGASGWLPSLGLAGVLLLWDLGRDRVDGRVERSGAAG
jgi:ACS family hexuronate transporter-like MFS transporter